MAADTWTSDEGAVLTPESCCSKAEGENGFNGMVGK